MSLGWNSAEVTKYIFIHIFYAHLQMYICMLCMHVKFFFGININTYSYKVQKCIVRTYVCNDRERGRVRNNSSRVRSSQQHRCSATIFCRFSSPTIHHNHPRTPALSLRPCMHGYTYINMYHMYVHSCIYLYVLYTSMLLSVNPSESRTVRLAFLF